MTTKIEVNAPAKGYQDVRAIVLEELRAQEKHQHLFIPGVFGPPGIGKSDMMLDICIELQRTFRPQNTGDNSDPSDIAGIAVPQGLLEAYGNQYAKTAADTNALRTPEVQKIVWALNRAAAEACEEAVMLFFDDIDKAPPIVAAGLVGLFGTRSFRDYRLHKDSLLVAAGNRLGDDVLASEMSESLRGRMTIIELVPNLKDFVGFAKENPDDVHPAVVTFLQAYPEYLFALPKEGEYRNPNPRSYVELSRLLYDIPESRWDGAVARKVGQSTAVTWKKWFNILAKIDLNAILYQGELPKEENPLKARQLNYGAMFRLLQHIVTSEIKEGWTGLEKFIGSLEPEFRVAMLVQIPQAKRSQLASKYEGAAELIMETLIK